MFKNDAFSIKKKSKAKRKNKFPKTDFKFLPFYLFFCIFIIPAISEGNKKYNRKLENSEVITLKVSEPGEQYVIWSRFYKLPNIEYINEAGATTTLSSQSKLNIPNNNYEVKLKWDEVLTKCANMFVNLTNIVEIDFSDFHTSSVDDMSGMFEGCKKLRIINFGEYFITSSTKSMARMFANCSSLVSLDLSKFQTSNVKNIENMFEGCSTLTSLDLSYFDTSSVERMDFTFLNCRALTYLDVSSFVTSKVVRFDYIFSFCSSLKSLSITNFDTSNGQNFEKMFYGCHALETIDVSKFNTAKAHNFNFMFKECETITILDLRSFDTSSVTDYSDIFSGCISLTSIDVSSFRTTNAKKMNKMFKNCKSLTCLDISNFDTSKVTKLESFFEGCINLLTIDVTNFRTSSCFDMGGMFNGCQSITTLDVTKFDTSIVTNMASMFSSCIKLTSLDLSNFITSKVKRMNSMFEYSNKLEKLNLANFETGALETMYATFHNCSSLTFLDISKFDTKLVTTMELTFCNCTSLTTLDITHFDTSKVKNMNNMFCFCALESLNLNNFKTQLVEDMGSMFISCTRLQSLDLSNFDTSKVNNMESMFDNCLSITSIDVTKFDTSKVTNMNSIFSNCQNLNNLDLSSFNTENVDTMNSMFEFCSSLTSLNLSNFDISKVTDMSSLFEECINLEYINIEKFKEGSNVDVNNLLKGVREDIAFCIKDINLSQKVFEEFEKKLCEYYDCDYNWRENKILSNFNCEKDVDTEGGIPPEDVTEDVTEGVTEDVTEDEFFKYRDENTSIYAYELEDLDELIDQYPNLTLIDIPDEEKKKLLDSFGLDEDEELYVYIVDTPSDDPKTATSDYEYKFFTKNGTELNLSKINDDITIIVNVPIRDLDLANFDYALEFDKYGYDIYDKNSEFYIDPCTAAFIHRNDIPLKDRKRDIYPNVTICKGGNCHYKSANLDQKRIVCECNINADKINETEEDDYMEEVDVGNYILDNINYKIIKCYPLELKWKNLVKNPAFYIIVLSYLLVLIFYIKFMCCGLKILKTEIYDQFTIMAKLRGFVAKDINELKKRYCHHHHKLIGNPLKKVKKGKKKKIKAKKRNNNQHLKETDFPSEKARAIKSDSQAQSKNYLINKNIGLSKVKKKPSKFSKVIGKKTYKTKSILKSIKINDIDINNLILKDDIDEYMRVSYDKALLQKKIGFCLFFYSLLFYKIDGFHLLRKNNFFRDLCVGHIITGLILIFFFNAFFYSDEIVSHKYHSNGQLDFAVTLGLCVVSILLTFIIIYYLKRCRVLKRMMIKIIEIKNEEQYLKEIKKFIKSAKIQATIAFIFESIIISWGYFYIVLFFIIYYQSRKDVTINFLFTILAKLIISLIFILIILLMRTIAVNSKISCLYSVSKFLYEIF